KGASPRRSSPPCTRPGPGPCCWAPRCCAPRPPGPPLSPSSARSWAAGAERPGRPRPRRDAARRGREARWAVARAGSGDADGDLGEHRGELLAQRRGLLLRDEELSLVREILAEAQPDAADHICPDPVPQRLHPGE